jgi:hypothetical protein
LLPLKFVHIGIVLAKNTKQLSNEYSKQTISYRIVIEPQFCFFYQFNILAVLRHVVRVQAVSMTRVALDGLGGLRNKRKKIPK